MTVDAQTGHRNEKHGDNDVPVNKITSFNGRLNQYFHNTKNVVASNGSSTVKDTLKRDSSSQEQSENDLLDNDNGSDGSSRSKRRKGPRLATATPTPEESPARITRSRSASLLQTQSPQTFPITRSQSTTTVATTTTTKRGRGSRTASQTSASRSLLRDTIPRNLTLLLVGVNPGILTGTTGHAYAHPSNLFWKLLHWSRITDIRHPPSDTYRLPELYNIGNTNIVERPTRDASMLSRAEMDAGVPVLEAKVADKKPEVVCLVGKSIWEAVWRVKHGRGIKKEEFKYGWQGQGENMGVCEGWGGARVFVATTTSGLAAGMSIGEKRAVWEELGSWVVRKREEGKQGRIVTGVGEEGCEFYSTD
ncbi:mismatch-specific DNA-glycosylase [Aspergillus chevalieri]|uniref:Uracil-DNA glycosylase-like domain-containing protein n=1 Tax=Aspergillus chevalieri TaxID=182096 RepID=A0A7R7ZIR2_ASPCH|nr:uncharacterized protein ACHE_10146S [Aspergillus chevalieri]BCR82744.1 hypothetical protein ACHE_10146S [Aspergillus chevalieri]